MIFLESILVLAVAGLVGLIISLGVIRFCEIAHEQIKKIKPNGWRAITKSLELDLNSLRVKLRDLEYEGDFHQKEIFENKREIRRLENAIKLSNKEIALLEKEIALLEKESED